LFIAFGAKAATAQTPPFPQPTLQQLGAPSVSAGYCEQSRATGPVFLSQLNSIVNHRDLTDIPFLEKALGTKLSLIPGTGPNGTPDTDILTYSSDQVLGGSLPVEVTVFKGKEEQQRANEIASVQFDPNSAREVYSMRCLRLTGANFVTLFGNVTFAWTGGTLPGGVNFIHLNTPGKNNTKLDVSFGYRYYLPGRATLHNELVIFVDIKESP